MAKDPKLGGLRPGDENYKLLLEGIAKRQEAAAKAQEEAAKAQETAASSVEVAAEEITKATDEQIKVSLEIGDILKDVKISVNSIVKSADSITDRPAVAPGNQNTASERRANIFADILNTSKDILNATKVNSVALEDILSAIQSQNILRNAQRKESNVGNRQQQPPTPQNKEDAGSLGPLLTGLAIGLGSIVGAVKGWYKSIVFFIELFETAGKLVKSVVTLLFDITKVISSSILKIAKALSPDFLVKFVEESFASLTETIDDLIILTKKFFTEKFNALSSTIEEVVGKVGKFFSDGVESILGVFEESFNFIKKMFTFGEESSVTKIFSSFKEVITNIGEVIVKITEPFIDAFKVLFSLVSDGGPIKGIFKTLESFAGLFKEAAAIMEKRAFPLMVIMGVWDTVKGAIEGYKKEGIIGAIKGAITGLFDSLVGGLLDLLKDAASWVLDKLGFKNASKFLDSFSFQDLFKKLVDAVIDPINWIIGKISSVFSSIGDAISKTVSSIPGVGWIASTQMEIK